jgi:hypothetical protein
VRKSDANTHGVAKCYTYYYCDTYPDSSGYSYTYSAGYGYTYGKPKLHTELCIHIGDRNTRAGSHRHWQPLR